MPGRLIEPSRLGSISAIDRSVTAMAVVALLSTWPSVRAGWLDSFGRVGRAVFNRHQPQLG